MVPTSPLVSMLMRKVDISETKFKSSILKSPNGSFVKFPEFSIKKRAFFDKIYFEKIIL